MKSLSLIFLLAFSGFGFSGSEPLKGRSADHVLVPSGIICREDGKVACSESTNYRLRVTHCPASGTAPTTLDILINGVDTGNNVAPGGIFLVPKVACVVTLRDGMSLYGGITLYGTCTEECSVPGSCD